MTVIVAAAALWGVTLVGIVAYSWNSAALNRRQMRRADAVVTATVTDAVRGTVKIDRVWFQKKSSNLKPTDSLTVRQLQGSRGVTGESFVIPLTKQGDRTFQITKAHNGDENPAIYPANESAIRQMEEIARER